MKSLTCGRVRGHRAAEVVCAGLARRFGVKARRLAVYSDDTAFDYLVTAEAATFNATRRAELLAYAEGAVEALVASGVTTHAPYDRTGPEWGGVTHVV